MKKMQYNTNNFILLFTMSEVIYTEFKEGSKVEPKKTEFINVDENDLLDENSLSDEELKLITSEDENGNKNALCIEETITDSSDELEDIENIIDAFSIDELNSLQIMLNNRRSRMCGPLSWKKERDAELKSSPCIRSIGENKWNDGLVQLQAVGRERYKDLIIEIKYNFADNDINTKIEFNGAWVYFILSLYDENNDLQYYKIVAYIPGGAAYKLYSRSFDFDIMDYLLRSSHLWKTQELFDIEKRSAIV